MDVNAYFNPIIFLTASIADFITHFIAHFILLAVNLSNMPAVKIIEPLLHQAEQRYQRALKSLATTRRLLNTPSVQVTVEQLNALLCAQPNK